MPINAARVVESLFSTAGKPMPLTQITLDPNSRRPAESMINLGAPRRAWMFASLSNERDRPSLSLPRAQAVTDVLEAFGWTGSRQNPRTDRESDPNVMQPGVLANSLVSGWITRASRGSALANLVVESAAGALLAPALVRAESPAPLLRGKAEHVISIWLGGGMGQIDTFDPKRRGDPQKKIAGSYYDSIDTAVPGVSVCEHLKNLAPLMD